MSALLIFVSRFIGERKSPTGSYFTSVDHLLDATSAGGLPLVEILPFWLLDSAAFRALTVSSLLVGCSVVFFFPRSRIGYFVAFIGMFAMAFLNHLYAGAHITAIYLVLFFLLFVQPPTVHAESTVRRNLVTALAAMYLFSTLSKCSASYLSGDVIVDTFAELIRWPLLSAMHYRPAVWMFVSWGLVLELLGFLILMPRLRRLGLLSAIFFHLLVGASITRVVNITAYALTLPILFASDREAALVAKSRFVVAGSVIVAFLFAWSFLGRSISSGSMSWVYDGVSWLWIFSVGYLTLRSVQKRPMWSGKGFSWLGCLVPVVFFFAAWIFSWPEPLGYTQYSGREQVFYGAIFSGQDDASEFQATRVAKSRWGVRFFNLGNGTAVGLFPTRAISKHAIESFCAKFPMATVTEIETPPRGSSFTIGRGMSAAPAPYRVTTGGIECSKFGVVD
ncbi:MAG: hypothetical protein JNJ49_15540 [Bdellovibrionaceae bacterium]|nr:hypothetical protein [Pseudobdellovibrionaceae bacterium]